MVALKFKEYGNTKPGRMGRGVLSQQVERHVLVHHTPVIKWLCVCVCVHMQRCVCVCVQNSNFSQQRSEGATSEL